MFLGIWVEYEDLIDDRRRCRRLNTALALWLAGSMTVASCAYGDKGRLHGYAGSHPTLMPLFEAFSRSVHRNLSYSVIHVERIQKSLG